MDQLIRFLVISGALFCAAMAAVVAMAAMAVLDPITRIAGLTYFLGGLLSALGAPAGENGPILIILALLQGMALAICVAPVTIAALVGELARMQSWRWYACCSGLIAAAMPFDLPDGTKAPGRSETSIISVEGHFVALFFFVGLIAGTIYWLMAGQNAGGASSELKETEL